MNWFTVSLISTVILSFGQIYTKKGLSTISPLWNSIIDATFSFILYIGFAFTFGSHLVFNLYAFLLVVLISGCYTFYYYAIEKGTLAISGTILASYPLVTIILSFLFLHERVFPLQICMMGVALCGVILLSYESGAVKNFRKIKHKTMIFWAIFSAVAAGFGDFLAKGVLNKIDIGTYMFYFAFAFAISTGIFWIFDKNGRKLPKKISFSELKSTLIGTFLLSCFILCFNYALSLGKASLVSVTSSSYVALTAILAYLILHEKISRRQIIGIILVSVGVVLVGYTG